MMNGNGGQGNSAELQAQQVYGQQQLGALTEGASEAVAEHRKRRLQMILDRMSPIGTLGLPKLLDQRRFEYGITDAAFLRQAAFTRILVWQIPMKKGDTFEEGGLIQMTNATKAREADKAPHGIIVSAGLAALDALISNGIDIGHRILFCHSAPYFVRYDTIDGQDHRLVVLDAGDIIASEDLATDLKARKVRVIQNRDSLTVEHVLVDENGRAVLPMAAQSSEE